MRLRTKIASGALALASLGGGALALAPAAHADYVPFGGVSMIDTQRVRGTALAACDEIGTTGDANIDCYTWIRTNGVARRGSPTDYWVEASNGFVYAVCSHAWRFAANHSTATSPTDADWFGQVQSPFRYNWLPEPNRSVYCVNPVDTTVGTTYYGFSWPDVPNGNSQ